MDLGLKGKSCRSDRSRQSDRYGECHLPDAGERRLRYRLGRYGPGRGYQDGRSRGKHSAAKPSLSKSISPFLPKPKEMAKAALKEFGKIDILVNTAGLNAGMGSQFMQQKQEIWEKDLLSTSTAR